MCLFECFSSSSEIKLSGIGNFGELSSALLGLVEIIVCSLNPVIRLTVFTFLHTIQTPQLINVLLITVALFLEFAEFKMGVINFLFQPIARIRLLSDVSLSCKNFLLPSVDLFPSGSNLTLQVVVVAVLFVQQESGVVNLFTQHVQAARVGIMALFEVVVLEQLLVLQVSVLGLDGIQLISECQIVFVTLLDLEDLGF